MSVSAYSLCIPFRTDHADRARIHEWLWRYYAYRLPDAEICVGTDDGGGQHINRCKLRNDAARQATTDILLFLDADALVPVEYFAPAADAVRHGANMVQFNGLHWLNHRATELLLLSNPTHAMGQFDREKDIELTSVAFPGLFFGISRTKFDLLGGWDERFEGWGEEDPAMQHAVRGAFGPITIHEITLYHLKHSFTEERSIQTDEFLKNSAIREEYRALELSGDTQAMLDYCQHRRPFVFVPPAAQRVSSTDTLVFHHPSKTHPPFCLPKGYDGEVPRWVTTHPFFRQAVHNGIVTRL